MASNEATLLSNVDFSDDLVRQWTPGPEIRRPLSVEDFRDMYGAHRGSADRPGDGVNAWKWTLIRAIAWRAAAALAEVIVL